MKKIAVMLRDRQSEALRMAIGLTILNEVDVYILDATLEANAEVMLNIEMAKEMRLRLYTSNILNEGMEYITIEDVAKRLKGYDSILPY
ncbi:MAG: hypothetical protein QMD01_07240 [Thermodesulfovibrionales bacterium]|nr:hypothetical protein [Thermodesulfovibrionales bacterium]